MPSLNIYNQQAEVVGQLELADKLFALKPQTDLIHQAVIAQMANERQVLAHTKTRAEVRGGGKKPWKQKGTGRARVGSRRSPLWIGGGIIFGPRKDRNFTKKINQKMKQKALLMVLSDKIKSNNLVVLDKLEMAAYKTKDMNNLITTIETKILKNAKRDLLIVNDKKDELVKVSARNLKNVSLINLNNINIVDLMNYQNLVFTASGLKALADIYKK